ncbi:MAG TPA: 3-oxoacyl-[acyl-carrier-protein] synthase III C-terminal domain-containing protein [Chloroflexaceae bacterium]|nr:3-oxoacyl-[acyl-carrier-protein] synthase III C-terminal domain-containing protein [Chloroflexaceae bacterium]
MLPITIVGLGSYLPARVVASAELEVALGLPPGWAEQTTGVRERRYAAGETSAGMAAEAARRALAAAGRDLGELDLIVGASSGPQQAIPCTAALVQRELGAPDGRSACFDVNATCLSFLFALQSAAHMVAAGAYSCALIVSSEIGTHSRNPAEPEGATLFGDAAAAAVITRTPQGEPGALQCAKFATYGSGAGLTSILGGGTLHHPNDPATTPEMNRFHMHGPGLLRLAARTLGPFLDAFFAEAGWAREEIDLLVPHQASRNGLGLLTARLGFRPEQVFLNLAERGNCIAASLPLALAEAAAQGRVGRGDRVVLLGTGAGMTIGAVGLTF